jgi:hypothetical protein
MPVLATRHAQILLPGLVTHIGSPRSGSPFLTVFSPAASSWPVLMPNLFSARKE